MMGQSRKKWVLILALLVGLIAIPLMMMANRNGKAEHGPGQPPAPNGGPPSFAMPVEVAPVTVGPLTETVNAVGTLEANESVMIRPEIPGRITRVNVQEGQKVKKGTVLLELDSAELEAQLAQAAASLDLARLDHDRMKRLIANDNVSRRELDQAASNLKSADATYKVFEERLAKTKIRSPFAGYLGTRRVSPGDYVQPGRDIVNLEDIHTLKINFMVPETFFSRLAVRQTVEVRADAFPGQMFHGTVYSIDPRVDEVSRTVRVLARIPNDEGKLRPGMFANVSLVLGHTEKALLIPEEAVVPQQGKTFVFRVDEKTAHLAEVKLGARERGKVQVLTGLQDANIVVTGGVQKIRDGMPVMPINPQ
ncbi:MAG: efflux RND transporter periplasmic adaptor subunit [Nitrospiraceae bacterium]